MYRDDRSDQEVALSTLCLLGSLIVGVAIPIVFVAVAQAIDKPAVNGVWAAAVLGWQAHAFRWSVERLDITPPKPFREAAEGGDD